MAAPIIQFKRGAYTNLPGLRQGEPGFTTDKYDLYVGLTSETTTNQFFGSGRYWDREDGTESLALKLVDKDGTNSINLKGPDAMSGVTTYTFPAAPEANKILLTDGDGNLSWTESFDSDLNVTGIVTATGGFNIGINSAGNTITSGPVQNLNFIGAGNTFAYNADTDTVDIAISGTGDNLTLGTSSDGDLVTPGALNTFTTETKIVDSIDDLNELALNMMNNTAVSGLEFSTTPTAGGSPFSITLATVAAGNPNNYYIDWGDGTADNTSDSTPSHTYNEPNGGQFSITMAASNTSGTGAGSSFVASRTNYITVYTPDPSVAFSMKDALNAGSTITFADSGTAIFLENSTTNVTGFDVDYTVNFGDGTTFGIDGNAAPGGVGAARTTHTFNNAAETDTQYTINLSLDSHPAADPNVIPASDSATFKVYSEHTPSFTGITTIGINSTSNSGLPITFTNTTESTIGSFADFGIRYRWTFGDGTTTTVNTGSSNAGDTNRTISNTYDLSSNSAGVSSSYTAKLEVLSDHTNSPFASANYVVTVEPEVRSIFSGAAVVTSDRTGDNSRTLYDGTDLNGNDRRVGRFTNTSHNASDYTYAYGDGSSDDTVANNAAAGGTSTPIDHAFQGGPGSKTVTLTANGTPGHLVQNGRTSNVTMTVNAVPAAPTNITTQTLSMSSSSQGTQPYLCSGYTDNQTGVGIATGSSVTRYATTTPIVSSTLSNIDGSESGTLSARLNTAAIGSKAFTLATGETGTFDDLIITSEGDAHDEISSNTYPSDFYQVFTARVSKPLAEVAVGLSELDLSHSIDGNAGRVMFVKDDLNTTPTLSTGTLAESGAGSKRYISGIPYYNTGSPTLTLSGVEVTNFTGQTYQNTTSPFVLTSGTNAESTSGNVVSSQNYTYANIDGTSTMLDGGVPKANTGVGGAYALGDLSVSLTSSSVRSVQTVKFRAKNPAGNGAFAENATKVQVHTSAQSGISEIAIPVADALGNGVHTDDGVRVFNFSGDTTDNPSYTGSTNFYTNSPYTEASDPGVQGTKEATIRLGVLKHDTTDYSTGFLPVGPNRSGDTGTQYFTFAFRRQVAANFDINITSAGISGLWIAAPGTGIDSTSGLNGWLRADTAYAGAGVPGSGAGGNGSDGCAFNNSDRIQASTALSGGYTMTLGEENMSNATGNVVLVRIALASGQSVSSLSIAEAVV